MLALFADVVADAVDADSDARRTIAETLMLLRQGARGWAWSTTRSTTRARSSREGVTQRPPHPACHLPFSGRPDAVT